MRTCFFRDIQEKDYKRVMDIYNSNHRFLINHLGMTSVEETFVVQEITTMLRMKFQSRAIVNRADTMIQGIIEFKPEQEVYLSLFMLDAKLQGKGLGRYIYSEFEKEMIRENRLSIRIDVVDDYTENLIPFWKSLGFTEEERVVLYWGNKKSNAVVMRKKLSTDLHSGHYLVTNDKN